MVKHCGSVLAVEGTCTDRSVNRVYSYNRVVKRRTGVRVKTASARASRSLWRTSRRMRVSYPRGARAEAVNTRTCSRTVNRMYSWNGGQKMDWFA